MLQWIKQRTDGRFVIAILSSFRYYHYCVTEAMLAGFNGDYFLGDKVELKLENNIVTEIKRFQPTMNILQSNVENVRNPSKSCETTL